MDENSPSSSLSDYISAIGGAAGQVIAAVNGPKTAAAGAPKTVATAFPKWILFAVIGVVVLIGGFLILRRR